MCSAHPWNQRAAARPTYRHQGSPSPALVCLTCSKVARPGQLYCTADGSRLSQGKICSCGVAGEPTDIYCGKCGQLLGSVLSATPELTEEEIAALEAKARARPSDIEMPPTEIH
jgi:hypothetical protein